MKLQGIVVPPLLIIFIAFLTAGVLPLSGLALPDVNPVIATPTPTPTPEITEQESYDKAISIIDNEERIAAIRKYLKDFGESQNAPIARQLLVNSEIELGKLRISNLDLAGAETAFISAISDAPSPVTDSMFSDSLMPLPSLLVAIGQRDSAFKVSKAIEDKAAGNAAQLLRIADFYMQVEDGTDAARVARVVLEAGPNAGAFRTLGLAKRIDFSLEEAAAAFEKALALEPDSRSTKLMLADMYRALGKSTEAAAMYRAMVEANTENQQARSGLVLALFDSGKKAEAEAELSKAIENGGTNVVMLAGAAYWYAANGNGKRAIELAQQAIGVEPRYIWSHIALADGYLAESRPIDAERTLMAARKYGNFPTLDYEIASARLAAGLYREAGDLLDQRFRLSDEGVSTLLGGRIEKTAGDFVTLLDLERQASILAPRSADSPEVEKNLRTFLRFYLNLGDRSLADEDLARSADEFTAGTDPMRVYRLLFASKELLSRGRLPEKVQAYADLAVGKDEAGLSVASPATAVLADELYEPRQKASSRDEYIQTPDVPRRTLSAILRGRIEEIGGTVLLNKNETEQAIVRLKRAVSVLPADTPWWRSSTWKLGTALEKNGDLSEALESYVKCYKSDYPNGDRYAVIEALYVKVHEGKDGLEKLIGKDPRPAISGDAVAKLETSPTPVETPEAVPSASPEEKLVNKTTPGESTGPPLTPETLPATTPTPVQSESVENLAKPQEISEPTPTPEASPTTTPTPVTDEQPVDETILKEERVEPTPDASPVTTPTPLPDGTTTPEIPVDSKTTVTPSPTPSESTISKNAKPSISELFPPVVIKVGDRPKTADGDVNKVDDKPKNVDPDLKEAEPPVDASETEIVLGDGRKRIIKPSQNAETAPCMITLSDESLLLQKGGGDLSVIVGTEDDRDLSELKVTVDKPDDIRVRKEPIAGIKGRALFVITSSSNTPGRFKVIFELPCGQTELSVTVH